MAGISDSAIVKARFGKARGFAVKLAPVWVLFKRALETEVALRRPFLWLPVAAGSGVVLYLYADREPSFWLIAPAAALTAALCGARKPESFLLILRA
jgi:competence protein ComEC